MRHQSTLFAICSLALSAIFTACGEDRSGEQPFKPTVVTADVATQVGDSVQLMGYVTASPNSSLKECGFTYGNDTLKATAVADSALTTFTAFTDSLGKGTYYAVAYARNGVGTSNGDTIWFEVK